MKRSIVLLALSLCTSVWAATPGSERQQRLLHMLHHDCGSCHGLTLKGGLGPALLPETLNGKPPAFLVQTIMDGRPGTAMPPWRPMLTEDEATWLVQQLLTQEAQQ